MTPGLWHWTQRWLAIAIVLLASLGSPPVAAQSYPSKPIRLIVPYAPGGGNDTLSRAIGQKLTQSLGQPLVVDNRAGSGGVIGADIVAKAAPDGYTLLMASSELAVSVSLIATLPYDPLRDFAPVARVGETSYLLVVHPSLSAKSVSELIALAKARPGQLNYASAGVGSPLHLAAELFKWMTGTNLVQVTYKGGAPAVTATLAGETQVVFGSVTTTLQLAKAGRVRALAVTSAKRSPLVPDLPTVAEAGVPGYELVNWYGVLAPARTPKVIVSRLASELAQIMALPDIRERALQNQGIEAVASTTEEFAAVLKNEVAKWRKLTKAIGIRAE
ncbi:MAG TPA: tripartite tricarboxylate transporter substrate binding protein [Burkholderiales bacterium]|jgi:tripartite-type tricarboxylate transporter receptor subunit TctC|nr:tripartite tricarboxylate transporter substrate binding protein [Burkholderiales bacterium]